jgi:hypothetical protein
MAAAKVPEFRQIPGGISVIVFHPTWSCRLKVVVFIYTPPLFLVMTLVIFF